MAPRRRSVPSYCHHKATNQAFIKVPDGLGGRKFVYLGLYESPESHAEYRRILAELHTPGPSPHPAAPTLTLLSVNEVLLAFLRWAGTHYRTPEGEPTTEVKEIKRSIGVVRDLYGHTPAAEFGPKGLAAVRQKMVDSGWCRSLVNRRIDRVKRVFKWATAEELVPVSVYQALRTLSGLQKGRTKARESEPIEPVDPTHVAPILRFVRPPVRAMIRLQELTGMRPGEVCRLTMAEVDRTGEVWLYRPSRHKNAHRGKPRVIPLGPRSQEVLAEFLRGDRPPPVGFEHIDFTDSTARGVTADAYQEAGRDVDANMLRDLSRSVVIVAGCVVDPEAPIFSPARDREERFRSARASRKSKVPPSQQNRRKKAPTRLPSDRYHPHAYTNAIRKGCEKAGVPHWHPNQLRHTFASDVRRAHGLEAAQVLLGHSRADVTQVYAERNLSLAVKVAAQVG